MSKDWSLVIVLVLVVAVAVGGPAQADSAADCGRFFLKYDAKTKTMKCVSGKRKKKGAGVSARQIRRQQSTVQRILNQVQDILTLDDVGKDQQRRVQQLITEARQRVQEIRRQTSQLRQEQLTFSQEVASAAQQRTPAQIELSRSLEQQQRKLVQQLLARQRQLLQSQQRRGRSLNQ